MKKERRIYSKKPLTFYSFSFGSSSFVLWSPFWYFKTTASSSLQCSPLHHPTCLIFIRCYPLCTKIANISIIICLFSSSSSWHSSPLPYSLSSSILDFFVILSLSPPSSSVVFLLILLRSDHLMHRKQFNWSLEKSERHRNETKITGRSNNVGLHRSRRGFPDRDSACSIKQG